MKIAIIPARGGSTRIPRKNCRLFHGKPIIAYSIEAAIQEPNLFDQVIVSTDDEEISDIAIKAGAIVYWRDEEMAKNHIGTQEVAAYVLKHAWTNQKPEPITHACVIYATAPMIERPDLWRGWEWVRDGQRAFAFSVGTEPLQDAAQFYFGTAQAFISGVPLFGPRSAMIPIDTNRVCDINVAADWQRALKMYRALHPELETIHQPQRDEL